MKHVVVDLEMNLVSKKSYVRHICRSETIEIGAVMLDENLQEISSFRTYVKPEYNDIIERKISRLTGINIEMVENAPVFKDALRMFTDWCLGASDDLTVYSWSDSDYKQISKEMLLKVYQISKEEEKILSNDWSDFQKEFDVHLGFERQISLKMALDLAGVEFVGREHDALDDARNTAELLSIFRDDNLFEKTLKKIKEVMEPTPLGCSIGELIDFSALSLA